MKYLFKLATSLAVVGLIASASLFAAPIPARAAGLYEGFPTATLPLDSDFRIPMDTLYPNGRSPQTVVGTPELLKQFMFGNTAAGTASATAGAATLNLGRGVITSESLTTANGSTYTLTMTNSIIKAGSIVFVQLGNGSNTTSGATLATCTPAAGSIVCVVYNRSGSAALNGTLTFSYAIVHVGS